MKQVVIINPNSDERVTSALVAQAGALAPTLNFLGWTSPDGPKLIVDQAMLAASAERVERAVLNDDIPRADALIIGAIGDPGLRTLARRMDVPLTGLGHAALREVERLDVPFAIVTTTPGLEGPLTDLVHGYGLSPLFVGMSYTRGNPIALGGDTTHILDELGRACAIARKRGALAIVLGGGPLSTYASALQRKLDIPLVVPLKQAIASCVDRLETQKDP